MNNVTTDGSLDWSDYIRVPATPEQIKRYKLLEGDVLFNNTNSAELVGKSAIFLSRDEAVVFSNHFTRLRTKPDCLDPTYLAIWLSFQWASGNFARLCNRWVGQAAVQRNQLLSLPFPKIQLAEQRQIIVRLKHQLALVEKARTAIEHQKTLLDEFRMALLRSKFSEI
jgi:type I restriction enzyme S subunit